MPDRFIPDARKRARFAPRPGVVKPAYDSKMGAPPAYRPPPAVQAKVIPPPTHRPPLAVQPPHSVQQRRISAGAPPAYRPSLVQPKATAPPVYRPQLAMQPTLNQVLRPGATISSPPRMSAAPPVWVERAVLQRMQSPGNSA